MTKERKNVRRNASSTEDFQLHQVCRTSYTSYRVKVTIRRRTKWFEWQNVMIFATSWASQDSLNEKKKQLEIQRKTRVPVQKMKTARKTARDTRKNPRIQNVQVQKMKTARCHSIQKKTHPKEDREQ